MDYGEGKTREQETQDSVLMLGGVMLVAIVFYGILALVLWLVLK